MRKNFNFFVCLMLAVMASTVIVMADTYYKININIITENGASGKACAFIYGNNQWSTLNTQYAIGHAGLWSTTNSYTTTLLQEGGGAPHFFLCAQGGDIYSLIEGWYWNAECTQPITSLASQWRTDVDGNLDGQSISYAEAEADAPTTTVYVKFTKVSPSGYNWPSLAATSLVSGEEYYIYNPVVHRFLKAERLSTADADDATVFTYTKTGDGTENDAKDDDGVQRNLNYIQCNLTYLFGEDTKYVNVKNPWTTSSTVCRLWPRANDSYCLTDNNSSFVYVYDTQVNIDGSTSTPGKQSNYRNTGIYWIFIPKEDLLALSQVTSKEADGTVTINAAPNAIGTAYAQFNVSNGSIPGGFTYQLTGGDGNFVIDEANVTCSGGILTVPVIYTAQNRHSGTSTPASTATIRVTAHNGASTQIAAVSAYVDLKPHFALNVTELDWNHVGEEVVETPYAGMEIAASQRDRLSNKLVKNDAQTTGVAANNATWTATITGTNANQFKFANGTQSVSGAYSDDLLDVIYAPTVGGSHSATLHIVTSYTDANSNTLTDTHDIALSGMASNTSIITFAKAGNESPTSAESHNFGEIVGTNTAQITADLFISSQITNRTMIWSAPDDAFVFDQSSVDLTQSNQTLVFKAHHTTAVETNTDHIATLTISGKGANNEDVSATLTLSYTAKPLITPTVTWNWTTIQENSTKTNPITTNSNDTAWVLVKTGGDAITYNSETKTATAMYLHHEPGQAATFNLHINQTDSFAAVWEEYGTTIEVPQSTNIYIDSQAKFNQYKINATSSVSCDNTGKISVSARSQNFGFNVQGCTKISFTIVDSKKKWRFTRYYENEEDPRDTVFYGDVEVNTSFEFSLPVGVVQFRAPYISGKGTAMTNVHFWEEDTIKTDLSQVALVDNGNSIAPKNITATFANKQQVTISLNATAAQYFTISDGTTTGSSITYDSDDRLGVATDIDTVLTVALIDGVNMADVKAATVGNACQLILADGYTYNHEVKVIPITIIETGDITYKGSTLGTYDYTYNESPNTVEGIDVVEHITAEQCVVTLSNPSPVEGYVFQGWKINDVIVSCKETFTTPMGMAGSEVEAVFVSAEERNYKVGDVYFGNLNAALTAAGTSADSKVVTLLGDITLDPGDYTIPADVTFLIPHKANFYELQKTPDLVNVNSPELELAQKLSAFRTLTLKEGVTITCDGTICVAGNMVTANGGRKSAYPTGEVGLINMVHGGHIELNEGANLYCWGYIKGQDMDQGNNTVGTGTVTANAGSVIWEDFELGDWRGGSASLDIYNNNLIDHRQLFPFQSYAIQNIEIPTTFRYGSTLRTYTSITTGFGNHGAVFAMIGSGETMFKLEDSESVVRTWYDATTDLTCYELSGTAKLDQLNVTVYVSMSSKDFILPISNSMHIILTDELNLVNPLMAQAGSVIEIKPSATVNLSNELYLYDKDEWGLYVHNYYFRSFNNITSHKNRGAEDSKAGLDDAKLIVDGTFNINAGGKLYATAGGANVMGNNGGVINFNTTLPDTTRIWAVEVISGSPYIKWVRNRVYAANLCNEDGSYTRSIGGGNAFYNVNGRWFHSEDAVELEDHTYFFTYMDGGNLGTDDATTAAVYSHDKTGLEARMKWFNVTADENCENWWIGSNPAAQYNYTMLNDWHQFMATETENVYSGSNNKLYDKNECTWTEEGAVDENCLYTIGGVKKALVNGEFIPLESNGYDPAYHAAANASQYYICFAGCNWHPATKYAGESKAYTIHPEDEDLHYIWFNNDWMNVQREEPFFYTQDEVTNVKTFYEYVNGDWVVATPYVSVTDDAEERNFYDIHEAFRVASIKKDATIKLLRDFTSITESCVFETQNTTCTLDLNGHVLAGNVTNLVKVNAPGCTFFITDNTTKKLGKISNAQSVAVYAQKGTVVLNNGTLEAAGANAIACASTSAITINGGYLAAATKCVNVTGSACTISGGHFTDNTGLATYCAAHKYPFETADSKYRYEVSAAWTITFKDGETTLQTLHVKPGETPVYTAAQPTKDGYKFTGWNPAITAAEADATYQAQFVAKAAEEHCITLNSNGGNEGLQYVYVASGSAVGELPVATKEGHEFTGWYSVPAATGGIQLEATTDNINADVTYYARYNKNSYNLTWDANGGNLSGEYTSGSVQYGAAITAPTATKDGHTFISWNATPAMTMPAQDVTYRAQWSVAVKHYLQNIDGSYPAAPAATDDVTGAAGEYVTPKAMTFDGFITPATQTVRIGETDEVRYEYARRTYTITWDANGGTCATASTDVKHGATATLPEATWANHTLDGWFTKAVGGDEITASTFIQRNIGTLYAHWSVNVIAHNGDNINLGDDVTNLIIENGGIVNATSDISVTNLYLESNGSTTSGQLLSGANVTATNAYFDYKVNAKNHKWYSVALPWAVNATNGISVNGRTLTLGTDFDIIYYDGERRAAEGKQKCWKYLENNGDKTLVPGRLYMIGLMMDAPIIRFAKKSGASLLTTTTSVNAYAESTNNDGKDANWNGVANPALFHAYVNAGTLVGQVYDPETSSYDEIPMNTTKMVVGQGAFVQAPANKSITVTSGGAFSAPRRATAQASTLYDVRIAPAEGNYTDRLFVTVDDEKEADTYVIGKDLAKLGVSKSVAQMWINRYNTELCLNTVAPENGVAEYPVTIFAPKAGEYEISVQNSDVSDQMIYLTLDGTAIWNLSDGTYTLNLSKGNTTGYGLRISKHNAPQTTTGVEEAVVDAQGETMKVLINNQVFIIRGNNVYSVDGQLEK